MPLLCGESMRTIIS